MKQIFYLLLLGCLVQGCMKVENTADFCNPKPPKPVLNVADDTIINVTTGQQISLNIVNPSNMDYYTYRWIKPNGDNSGNNNYTNQSYTIYGSEYEGRYAVVYNSYSGGCSSDTTFFTVRINNAVPDCGTPDNTLAASGTSISTTVPNIDIYSQYSQVRWNTSNNGSLLLQLGTAPSANTTMPYQINSFASTGTSLNDYQAKMTWYRNGSEYIATSGTVYVRNHSMGGKQLIFCNVLMVNGSQQYTCNGNLRFLQ